MTPVVQQFAVNDLGFTSGTIQTATLNTKALTPGSMIVADFAVADAALNPALTDTLGLVWSLVGTPVYWANIGNRIGTFWAQNPSSSAASLTVTATYSASKVSRVLALREVTGLDSSASPVDVVATGKNNSATNAPTSNPMTTTAAGDWIHSVCSSDGGTMTAGAGYTVDTNGTSSLIVSEYAVGGAAGSVTVPWVQSGTQQCLVFACAFKAASGGGSNAATLSGKVPVLTGSITATQADPASLSGQTPVLTGAIAATQTNPAVLSASLPVLTGAIAGTQANPASLNGSTPLLTGSVTGSLVNAATLSGTVPLLAGNLAVDQSNPAALAGAVPLLTGSITDQTRTIATLSGSLPLLTGALAAGQLNPAALHGALPLLTGRLVEQRPTSGIDVTITAGPTRFATLTGSGTRLRYPLEAGATRADGVGGGDTRVARLSAADTRIQRGP